MTSASTTSATPCTCSQALAQSSSLCAGVPVTSSAGTAAALHVKPSQAAALAAFHAPRLSRYAVKAQQGLQSLALEQPKQPGWTTARFFACWTQQCMQAGLCCHMCKATTDPAGI